MLSIIFGMIGYLMFGRNVSGEVRNQYDLGRHAKFSLGQLELVQ
jgi:hypothetical protein